MEKQNKKDPFLVLEHYTLSYNLYPEEGKLLSAVELKVLNSGQEACSRFPLLLYRLLEIEAISDIDGVQLDFTQSVTRLRGKEGI